MKTVGALASIHASHHESCRSLQRSARHLRSQSLRLLQQVPVALDALLEDVALEQQHRMLLKLAQQIVEDLGHGNVGAVEEQIIGKTGTPRLQSKSEGKDVDVAHVLMTMTAFLKRQRLRQRCLIPTLRRKKKLLL